LSSLEDVFIAVVEREEALERLSRSNRDRA
jgi:hypothetical protein